MSWRPAAVTVAALLAAACARPPPPSSPAAPVNSCIVVGGPQAPLEVRIYESDPNGSPGGRRLFIGTLNRNERHLIQTPTGRIWYALRWHEGDSWREGHEAPCRDRAVLELP
jgi:hypothetical protein